MIPVTLSLAVPLATAWVEEQERKILSEGVRLTPHKAFDAHLVGVKNPGKVRLLKTDFIPLPENPVLRKANELFNLVSPVTAGITFGYGIYIREDWWGDRPLLAHELVHVGQYERRGSVGAFLRDYLEECLTIGYPNGPLEQEAILKSREVCGGLSG
jgi:hypothetical protein